MSNVLTAHREAELLRLRHGYEGCGCPDCQDYYAELDLSIFGARVKRYGDVVIVTAGITGADLCRPDDNEVEDTCRDAGQAKPGGNSYVSKIISGGNHTVAVKSIYETPKKRRGRPRKTGEDVSRATKYRRRAEQLALPGLV
jgi:hypothetical protein